MLQLLKDRMLAGFSDKKVMYKEGQIGIGKDTVYEGGLSDRV